MGKNMREILMGNGQIKGPTVREILRQGMGMETEHETQETATLIFWKNGFSIEDSELIDYDDPLYEKIMDLILSGGNPLPMINVKYNQDTKLKVIHRLQDKYVKNN